MKKIKLLIILILATISVTSCNNANDIDAAQYETHSNNEYTQFEMHFNAEYTLYEPTKEMLELDRRIFTEHGFSVATNSNTDIKDIVILKGHYIPFSFETKIKNELKNLLDEDNNKVLQQSNTLTNKSSSNLVAQELIHEIPLLIEDIEYFIENNLVITEEWFDVFGGNQHIILRDVDYFTAGFEIHKATVKINTSETEEFEHKFDVYNIPYKNNPSSGKRFDIVYYITDEKSDNQRLENIFYIADTFILDEDALDL